MHDLEVQNSVDESETMCRCILSRMFSCLPKFTKQMQKQNNKRNNDQWWISYS